MRNTTCQTGLITRHLMMILFALIIIHFFIMALYTENNFSFNKMRLETRAHQQIIKLLAYTSQTAPPHEFKEIIDTLSALGIQTNYFKVAISIDAAPKFPLQFSYRDKFETIAKQLQYIPATVNLTFSYLLPNNQWINYKELPSYSFYKMAAVLISIELIVLILLVFYGWAVTRFTVPLRNFKQSAERLGIDVNTSSMSNIYGPAIVKETAEAMHKMQQRIQDLINTRTKMLAAISHDLRTPITRLKLRCQLLEDDKQAQQMINDLTEMENMVSGVLSFARNDMLHESKVKFDIHSLIMAVCYDFADLGHAIHVAGHDALIPVFGRPLALKRVFINLISNAFKFATEVWVEFNVSGQQCIITVKDNGPGINEHELEKVFQAYYKSKETAAQNSTGTGLGLTIAYEIIKAHEGTIKLQNRPEGGLEVTVILPIIA